MNIFCVLSVFFFASSFWTGKNPFRCKGLNQGPIILVDILSQSKCEKILPFVAGMISYFAFLQQSKTVFIFIWHPVYICLTLVLNRPKWNPWINFIAAQLKSFPQASAIADSCIRCEWQWFCILHSTAQQQLVKIYFVLKWNSSRMFCFIML